MRNVANPISNNVVTRTRLRPSVSPRRPKTKPPIGREMYPTAKVVKASSVPVSGSEPGKNSCGKTSAAAVP